MNTFSSKKKLYGELEFYYSELERLDKLPKNLSYTIELTNRSIYKSNSYTLQVKSLKELIIKHWPSIVSETKDKIEKEILLREAKIHKCGV